MKLKTYWMTMMMTHLPAFQHSSLATALLPGKLVMLMLHAMALLVLLGALPMLSARLYRALRWSRASSGQQAVETGWAQLRERLDDLGVRWVGSWTPRAAVHRLAEDHRLGGRLALWGRRLMGEALTQAQRVAGDRESLTALLAGGVDRPGLDLAALGRMFTRLTELHAARMAQLFQERGGLIRLGTKVTGGAGTAAVA